MSGVLLAALAALAVALPVPVSGAAAPARIDGPLGPIRVFGPPVPPTGLVVLFSDRGGWDARMDSAAGAIAESGQVVAGIDSARALAAGSRDHCISLAPTIEAAARRIAADNGVEAGSLPLLAGSGAGATVAYATLAQAPVDAFAGAIVVAFSPELASPGPLCAGAATIEVLPRVFRYAPRADLPGWLRLATSNPKDPGLAPYVATPRAEIVAVRPQDDLASSVIAALAAASANEKATLADLPLVPMPVEAHGPLMAVIYSGDGGWRDVDREIGTILHARGVPVIGVDCLRYFWHERTPDEVAAGLNRILDHYPRAWHAPKVVLIGYSFGADVLPFAVNRLTPENRSQVIQISLLGLADRADFQIHVAGWLGEGPSDKALPVLPELGRLDLGRVQCFYGQEEDETACTEPALAGAEVIALPGGHHFGEHYDTVVERILAGVERRDRS